MSIILAKTERPYRHLITEELRKNPTADDVLNHLFGDGDGYINSDYTVRRYKKCNTSVVQRINALWVIPLYAVFAAPIMWILHGRSGLKQESKAYKFFEWLLGDIY